MINRTKKIFIDLRAIGCPIDAIQPVIGSEGLRNIFSDNIAGLQHTVMELIAFQFG